MIKSLLKYFYLNLLIDWVSQIICRNHFLKETCDNELPMFGLQVISFAPLHTEVSRVAALVPAGGIAVLWFPGHQLCFSKHRGLWGRSSNCHSCSQRDPCSLVPWSPALLFYTQRSLGSQHHSPQLQLAGSLYSGSRVSSRWTLGWFSSLVSSRLCCQLEKINNASKRATHNTKIMLAFLRDLFQIMHKKMLTQKLEQTIQESNNKKQVPVLTLKLRQVKIYFG